MRIAIVDDELEMRETLAQYIARYSEETDTELEVVQFASGDKLMDGYRLIYDIIIFDVEMPGTSGIDTARKLRQTDQRATILFVTNVAKYVFNGYEVDAVDYVLKPVSYYDFAMKFGRAVAKAAQKTEQTLKFETLSGSKTIRVSDLHYIEVLSHYLYFHTAKSTYKVRGSLTDWEETLFRFSFARAHKSFVVNLEYVEKIQSREVSIGGKVLPVGRGYKDSLRQEYMRYVRGEEK